MIGIVLGELVLHLVLMFKSERKNLHLFFITAFVSISFLVGFNNQYGMLTSLWPSYDYEIVKYFLFLSLNIYLTSVNFIFAVLPRFRKVNRNTMYAMSGAVLSINILYLFVSSDFHDILIAIDGGIQLAYLAYVMFHLARTIDLNRKSTVVFFALFILYILFVAVTSVYSYYDRAHCWVFFLGGSIFSVALSFIAAVRTYNNTNSAVKSGFSSEITNKIEELQNSNDAKDKFFSIIAHDLKTPISSITTLSEIYTDEASKGRDPHAKELASALHDSIDSLCNLLDDLLSWSRAQLGAIQCNPAYLDISDLIEHVKSNVAPLCMAKNIELRATIKSRDKVYADHNLILTVLRNLVTNAIKFSYQDSCVQLEFDVAGYASIIRVTDNGIGMSREALDSLFKIDKISSRPGTHKEQGTGLGLIVCNEFVKMHNGTIEVEAEEGLGTSIIVKLPFYSKR